MNDMIFPDYSLWDRLHDETRPIIIYGTGNGADKIIDALSRYGVTPDAVFASGGFVRERTFRGFTVKSYEAVREKYGDDIVILLAFGSSLPDVIGFIRELDRRHTLIIPEVPLYGGELFDFKYFSNNNNMITDTLKLFHDDISRRLYCDMIAFRLTGALKYLSLCEDYGDSLRSVFAGHKIKKVIDCGAFKGDSTLTFIDALDDIDEIFPIEPDPSTYAKLCNAFADKLSCKVTPMNFAVSDSCCVREFSSSGSRGAGLNGQNRRSKSRTVECRTLDSVFTTEDIDLIKYDVEGDEHQAICGSTGLIKRCTPHLAVSVYHRTDDLFTLTRTVHEICPSYKLYLRRVPCIPAWDITLFAVHE